MNTAHLLDALADRLDAGQRAVWVGVAAVRGSAPRAPGARMLVTRDGRCGTIGGGQLELRAIGIARQMLDDAAAGACPAARLERFPLGARVGQCCGGVVELAFDLVSPAERDWVAEARRLEQQQLAWLRIVRLGAPAGSGGHGVSVIPLARASRVPGVPATALEHLTAAPGDTALIACMHAPDPGHVVALFRPPELHLALFGAGHIGRALVDVLGRLPIRVTWIDPREDEFLALMPRNVRPLLTDCPEAEVRHLPADSAVLIATHHHALDFELVRAWLDRGDFRFLGLIGSHSKRSRFEAKLRARGYGDPQLARLTCPVGQAGVGGKEPEVIAVAIAAQLMTLRRIATTAPHRNATATVDAPP